MEPIKIKFTPLDGCKCMSCESARAEQSKTWPTKAVWDRDRFPLPVAPIGFDFGPIGPPPLPFAPEPAKAEPVYTHVLLDYDEDGTPGTDMAELHTAESLLEAIAWRKDQDERFAVYRLGESILDVSSA